MQFVKTHLISLICGVLALAFVGVGVYGMTQKQVVADMKKRADAAGEIKQLQGSPQNKDTIAAEQRRGEMFKAEFEQTLEEANRINKRAPLMSGVFPKAESDAARFEFKKMYTTARAKLPLKLMGGDAPGEREIAEEQQNIAEMMTAESGEAHAATPTGNPRGAAGAQTPIVATDSRGGARGAATGGPTTDPKLDPKVRARVARARSIRMYVSDSAFETSPLVAATAAPEPAEMWFAQMQLWAQTDIVDAIASFNNEAVANVADTDPYVEHSPVKRLERVKVWGYMGKNGLIPFPPLGDGNELRLSFTGKQSDEQFDIVRVTVTVIIDQREVVRFVDRVMRQNFYNCVHMEYGLVDRTTAAIEGYAYGTAPVVRLTIDLEAYFARKAYQELMPPDVQTLLGVTPQG